MELQIEEFFGVFFFVMSIFSTFSLFCSDKQHLQNKVCTNGAFSSLQTCPLLPATVYSVAITMLSKKRKITTGKSTRSGSAAQFEVEIATSQNFGLCLLWTYIGTRDYVTCDALKMDSVLKGMLFTVFFPFTFLLPSSSISEESVLDYPELIDSSKRTSVSRLSRLSSTIDSVDVLGKFGSTNSWQCTICAKECRCKEIVSKSESIAPATTTPKVKLQQDWFDWCNTVFCSNSPLGHLYL